MNLIVMRCPRHDFYAVATENPDGGGTRITPSKCCGQWQTVASWKFSATDWTNLSEVAENAAEDATTAPTPQTKEGI